MKILDCTLRDGGYYTNWDFKRDIVDSYLESMNHLPIDYLEIGYRSPNLSGYLGEYYYLPMYVMQRLRDQSNKKLVVILNEKDVSKKEAKELLKPCQGMIDMVRLAIDPINLNRAIVLAEAVKELGFEVGFNVMYMSKWKQERTFLQSLPGINGLVDIFYMVDSYGGVYPDQVKEIYEIVNKLIDVPIGFHGHNNLELALINTLTAIQCGAQMVDSTITGMGRGAGNLKTELLLAALNAKEEIELDFNKLSGVVNEFMDLQKEYEWGTNLPYMVSGANSLPQKEVMDWVGKRYYSYNSIIRALKNQKDNKVDNMELPVFQPARFFQKVLIIGGGSSVSLHKEAIIEYLQKFPNVAVIHASSRNANILRDSRCNQYFCLVGNEGVRMERIFSDFENFQHQCILPPFPRKMGTYVPPQIVNQASELKEVIFTNELQDTHTALALQTAKDIGAEEIYLVGYDGYSSAFVGSKEIELLNENEYLFNKFKDATGIKLTSLTQTKYNALNQASIYQI